MSKKEQLIEALYEMALSDSTSDTAKRQAIKDAMNLEATIREEEEELAAEAAVDPFTQEFLNYFERVDFESSNDNSNEQVMFHNGSVRVFVTKNSAGQFTTSGINLNP